MVEKKATTKTAAKKPAAKKAPVAKKALAAKKDVLYLNAENANHCIRRICRDLTWKRPEGFC